MKVFLELPVKSRGLQRVRDALVAYAPKDIEIVMSPKEADLVVLHVYGRYDSVKYEIGLLEHLKKPYAMIQYCLRSTMHPNTYDWLEMWQGSKVVWSYYDLPSLLKEDIGKKHPSLGRMMGDRYYFPFYHSPLGVDSTVFWERNSTGDKRQFIITASSQHALSESARECALAAKRVNKKMFFLGHELRRGDDIVCRTGIEDFELAQYYSDSVFVSGLRRIEGFEFPVIEGLLCGARPIVFDKPHYRKWFSEFAIFIPERSREKVIDDLELIFKLSDTFPIKVTEAEKALAFKRFSWSTIIKGFWDRILS